jgi:hypothetical protein
MLRVVCTECHGFYCYAKCRFAECQYAKCHSTQLRGILSPEMNREQIIEDLVSA